MSACRAKVKVRSGHRNACDKPARESAKDAAGCLICYREGVGDAETEGFARLERWYEVLEIHDGVHLIIRAQAAGSCGQECDGDGAGDVDHHVGNN